MLQKGASEEEIKQGRDGKYHILHTSLHWVVNSRANVVFSILGIYKLLFNLKMHFFVPFALGIKIWRKSNFSCSVFAYHTLLNIGDNDIHIKKEGCTGPLFGLVIKEELLRM